MSRRPELLPGSVLGRYELVLKIATGGMGEVWAARLNGSRGFQKVLAVKTLLPELSHNPNFEQAFLDEAALAARIKHPNVVQIIDLGEEDHILYQVMEWVSGASLWSVMRASARRDGIPLGVAARIICQICAGLHAAHELKTDDGGALNLVHRDVSPQNILITSDGLAKVVDFGVAKYAGRGVAETKAGELRGKVPYMAPEHVMGQSVDRRADVFALGVLLYQLVSGEHPFLADDDRLTLARISSPVPAAPLKKHVPSLPDAVGDIVAAALAKNPRARTATAADLMRALERALPDCALQSSNQLIADHMRETVGEQIETRARELREALAAIDDGTEPPQPSRRAPRSTPPRTPVTIPAPPGIELATLGAARLGLRPEPPPGHEPSVSGVSNTLDLSADRVELPVAFRSPWLGKRLAIVGASSIAVLAVAAIALSTGGGSDPAPAAAPEVGAAPPAAPEPTAEAPATIAPPPAPPPPTAPVASQPAAARAPGADPAPPAAAAMPEPSVAAPTAEPSTEAAPEPIPTSVPKEASTAAPVAKPPPAAPRTAPPSTAGGSTTKQKEFTPKGL
jgi:serine/threonine-protein kinase